MQLANMARQLMAMEETTEKKNPHFEKEIAGKIWGMILEYMAISRKEVYLKNKGSGMQRNLRSLKRTVRKLVSGIESMTAETRIL